MACSTIALALAMFGPPLTAAADAPVPTKTEAYYHPDVVLAGAYFPPIRRSASADSASPGGSGGVSVTPNNQILVELAPDDTEPGNLLDLSGQTVTFTPDGLGAYSRSVGPVAWVRNTGSTVSRDAEIHLTDFTFKFAGREWSSFFVSRYGALTFGAPLTIAQTVGRWDRMPKIATNFVTVPTISPLFKPRLGGSRSLAQQNVAIQPGRVVVTWSTTEPPFYVHGVPPKVSSRFQVVLMADGRIKFNYANIALRDGTVGLFFDEELTKGNLVASFTDPVDSELPGHLDLVGVAIYESNTDALIIEWTMREDIPTPPDGTVFSYRLYLDKDMPYFSDSWDDAEITFDLVVGPNGSWASGGDPLPRTGSGVISLLVEDTVVRGMTAGIRSMAAEFTDGYVQGDSIRPSLGEIALPNAAPTTDLSRSAPLFSKRQSEVFHYRSRPDPRVISCRVINALGDEFDYVVFHSEFRIDVQEALTPVAPYYGTTRPTGIGGPVRPNVPCGEGRLKAHWAFPVWMKSAQVIRSQQAQNRRFDWGLILFAHEFTHVWTARASYLRNGVRERLYGTDCECHWRNELHAPAAFPWHHDESAPMSLMGARYWRESSDGRFTPFSTYWGGGGGHSWLDLYMMGLAAASEVPDMFILRNLRPVNKSDPDGPHYGEKEVVTIQQVVAAEGQRKPSVEDSQKDFNVAFVYLLEPGRTPDPEMLRLHVQYRDKVIEHWSHVTGGRSRLTTTVPVRTDRPPSVQ